MNGAELHERLQAADQTLGGLERTLLLGRSAIRIEGLDTELASRLEARWGPFLRSETPGPPRVTLRLFHSGPALWLGEPRWGETYRFESVDEPPRRLAASYHFAVGPDDVAGRWRAAISESADEPLERIVENVVRFVTARVTAEDGGFALHASGVLRDGRAFLFAGPSRAGKSTVVRMLSDADSLGDDFGLVLPTGEGWMTPALPFDNAERGRAESPQGLFPVAGVWRLFQSERTLSAAPPAGQAEASMMGCLGFTSAMPDLAATLLDHVDRFVAEAHYRHLYFAPDSALWTVLL